MAIYTVLFEKLYTILKDSMREDVTNFFYKAFKILRFLRSSKCSKTTVELTFTAQKANAFSPWAACSFFDWVNLVQKLKIPSFAII